MKKMRTVKEVCELTGLNRKLLYVYDKEGIVKPSAYKNMGHEGMARKTGVKVDYDGYKLYDDAAVMKLQQIAIYEKLHIKRADIKAKFASTKSNKELLEEQIQELQQKKKEIEELIIVAEQLKLIGMKGEVVNLIANIDFGELARAIDKAQKSQNTLILEEEFEKQADKFDPELENILDKLFSITEKECESEKTMKMVEELFDNIRKNYGFIGWLYTMGLASCYDKDIEEFAELIEDVGEETLANLSRAIMTYLDKDIDKLWEEFAEVSAKHQGVIGISYNNPKVKRLVEETKNLLFIHTGVHSEKDYELFFDILRIYERVEMDYSVRYIMKALEYYHKNS